MNLIKASIMVVGLTLGAATAAFAAECACCENMQPGQRMACCGRMDQQPAGQPTTPAQDHSQHGPQTAPPTPPPAPR